RDALPTDMEIRMALQQLVGTEFASDASDVPSAFTMHGVEADDEIDEASDRRFDCYLALLKPLESVVPDRELHPEGDLLYHSLQVFELAKEAQPWDEEFLTAALLHDVGRGIDPRDAHQAGIAAIHSIVSERTLWFVQNLPLQHRASEGTIGMRARRRLEQHEDGELLRLLAACDSEGRVPGRRTGSLEDAIQWLRQVTDEW
ncbi:MAG: HD domain-containing protein, partial [Planctomycetaceae bacterium]